MPIAVKLLYLTAVEAHFCGTLCIISSEKNRKETWQSYEIFVDDLWAKNWSAQMIENYIIHMYSMVNMDTYIKTIIVCLLQTDKFSLDPTNPYSIPLYLS